MKTDLLAEVEAGTTKLAGKIADAIQGLNDQREKLAAQIAALNVKHQQLVGRPYNVRSGGAGGGLSQGRTSANSSVSPAARKSRKRIRRSPEQLEKVAGGVVTLIKSKKDGVSAGEIIKNFGVLIPSTKEFVKKWGGVNVRTTGVGAKTRYVA